MNRLGSRLPSLTTLLWIVASLVAFGAFLYIAPNLLNPPTPPVTPTGSAFALTPIQRTATAPSTATPIPLAPPAQTRPIEPFATPPPGALEYLFVSDPTRSGYFKLNQPELHLGDRNLHAGFFGADGYASVLFFDVSALPPNSELVSADLDLTGLSRDNLGAQGEWYASLLHLPADTDWSTITQEQILSAPSITTLGTPLTPSDLDRGDTNRLSLSADQLPAVVNEVNDRNYLVVRLDGPGGPNNNLFTWDGGGLDLTTGAHPTLRVVAHPGQFVVVTNTPTAENVVTAAAYLLKQTEAAQSVGTPTPFPRNYATATPIVLVTPPATAENVQTRVALAQIATAVAFTTGTYTPTPENWVLVTATFTPAATRTPEVVAASTLYARLTPTAQPSNTPTIRQMLQAPLPDFIKGKLLVVTDRFGGSSIAVMNPDGTITQGLTGDNFYRLAFAREPFSPDRQLRAVVAPDPSDVLQIWIEDQATHKLRPITHLARGIAYDPVWSPDGGRIAYVSRETGNDEIYIYDLGSETTRQVTTGGNAFIYKQRPTWSPDGTELAFKANDGTQNFQIWIMNADGSNLRNISRSTSNDTDPVWVK